jgi:glutamate dehydrogenase/leucine dehydrogenase
LTTLGISGLNLGGGKAVIIGDVKMKTEARCC